MSAEPHLQSVPGANWIGDKNDPPTPPIPNAPGSSDNNVGGAQPPSGGSTGGRAPSKVRPEQSVPTDRMRFDKQVTTLQTYAQLSGRNKQPVSADYLGKALEMSPATAGLCGGFFKDSGWLERAGRAYVATDALLEYQRRINLDPEDSEAVKYLADAARNSWYWHAVEPMLGVGVRQNMLLVTLSQAANAHDHKAQLLLLIDWMAWLGLVRKDGDMVYPVVSRATASAIVDDSPVRDEDESTGAGALDAAELLEVVPSSTVPPSVPTVPEKESESPPIFDTGALVSFNFSVRITAEDAAKLTPENIASLLEVVEKLRG